MSQPPQRIKALTTIEPAERDCWRLLKMAVTLVDCELRASTVSLGRQGRHSAASRAQSIRASAHSKGVQRRAALRPLRACACGVSRVHASVRGCCKSCSLAPRAAVSVSWTTPYWQVIGPSDLTRLDSARHIPVFPHCLERASSARLGFQRGLLEKRLTG